MLNMLLSIYAVGAVIAWFNLCFYVSRKWSREDTKGAAWVIWVLAILWPLVLAALTAEWLGKLFAYGPEWMIDRMRKKPPPEPVAKDEYR